MPPRPKGAERDAVIRRKLEAGIKFNRARIVALAGPKKMIHAHEITTYLSASDEWLRGERNEYPKTPSFLRH